MCNCLHTNFIQYNQPIILFEKLPNRPSHLQAKFAILFCWVMSNTERSNYTDNTRQRQSIHIKIAHIVRSDLRGQFNYKQLFHNLSILKFQILNVVKEVILDSKKFSLMLIMKKLIKKLIKILINFYCGQRQWMKISKTLKRKMKIINPNTADDL